MDKTHTAMPNGEMLSFFSLRGGGAMGRATNSCGMVLCILA